MSRNYGEEQRIVKKNVFDLLEQWEDARNSDKFLMLKYWQTYDGVNTTIGFGPQFLRAATTPESITRARRSIQSTGLFLPTDEEVIRKRRIRQEEAREHHVAN